MIEKSGQSFITCYCKFCSGGIEFERDLFDPENAAVIECPHCGAETQLYIPTAAHAAQAAFIQKLSQPRGHKLVSVAKRTRIALTSKQCASPEGQELVSLLCDITRDGLVTKEGVWRLNNWLEEKTNSDLPAVKHLTKILEQVQTFTTEKAFEIHVEIEHVLPKVVRGEVKKKRKEAWLHSPLQPKATEAQLKYIRGLGGTPPHGINIAEASLLIDQLIYGLPNTLPTQYATEKQLEYIRSLGGNPPPSLTKSDASTLIERLLNPNYSAQSASESIRIDHDHQPPTPRQIMVLRFWNRMDLEHTSKGQVERWLDEFYRQNRRRKAAWELYKYENKDDGTQSDPSWVEIGAGEKCLRKIARTRTLVGMIILAVVGLVVLVFVLILHFSKN